MKPPMLKVRWFVNLQFWSRVKKSMDNLVGWDGKFVGGYGVCGGIKVGCDDPGFVGWFLGGWMVLNLDRG